MFDFSNCELNEALDHIAELGNGLSEHSPEFSTKINLPGIVREAGIQNKMPLINQYVLYKITAKRKDDRYKMMHPHKLTKEMILTAFSKVSSPVAIVKTEDNSVFILTDVLDKNNDPIGIAIKYNKERDENMVCSCYGRNSFMMFLSTKAMEGSIIQCNKKKLTHLINTVYDKKIKDELALPEDKINALHLMSTTMPEKKKTLSSVKKRAIEKREAPVFQQNKFKKHRGFVS